jgi:hypothetical protein
MALSDKQLGKNFAVFIVGADLRVCPGVTSYTAAGADTQVCPGVTSYTATGADTQVCPYDG